LTTLPRHERSLPSETDVIVRSQKPKSVYTAQRMAHNMTMVATAPVSGRSAQALSSVDIPNPASPNAKVRPPPGEHFDMRLGTKTKFSCIHFL
jgi:hypothetical protein